MKNTLGPDQLGGCHSLPFKGEGVGISRKDMTGLVSLSLSLSLSCLVEKGRSAAMPINNDR